MVKSFVGIGILLALLLSLIRLVGGQAEPRMRSIASFVPGKALTAGTAPASKSQAGRKADGNSWNGPRPAPGPSSSSSSKGQPVLEWADFAPAQQITATQTLTVTAQAITATATLAPLPSITFVYPQITPTSVLLRLEQPSGSDGLPKGTQIGFWEQLQMWWPAALLGGLWVGLAVWLVAVLVVWGRSRR